MHYSLLLYIVPVPQIDQTTGKSIIHIAKYHLVENMTYKICYLTLYSGKSGLIVALMFHRRHQKQ